MTEKMMFVSHACLLVEYQYDGKTRYLLTDPWFKTPAFGSWLPHFPPGIGEERLFAMAEEGILTVAVSHGHDDHCDNQFIKHLSCNTPIVIPKYKSPGLKNRLAKLGMLNINIIEPDFFLNGICFNGFINAAVSEFDAIVTIETPQSLLVHCNDNWNPLNDETKTFISKRQKQYKPDNSILMSQSNSASGYPFAYENLSDDEKKTLNHKKVLSMVNSGLNNCRDVGIKHFLSYAGFASVYVDGHAEYREKSITPTKEWIDVNCKTESVNVLNMLAGDVFNFGNARVDKAFASELISTRTYSKALDAYYKYTGDLNKCDTFNASKDQALITENELAHFLEILEKFVSERQENIQVLNSIKGKVFKIIINDSNITQAIKFGFGIEKRFDNADKTMLVDNDILKKVIDGKISFENLYIGFEARWSRDESYNPDIIMGLIMFSYYYINNSSRLKLTPS